ncbi:MAG: SdpI family protein, partial [Acidimicrobiales bacterium]
LTFTAGVHALTIANGLGMAVPIERVVPLAIGVLLVFLGNYLARVEPNWFVGIRTPWTLSSDAVWRQTHRTGGPVFVVAGLVVAAAALAPRAAAWPIMIAAIAGASLIPVVQSYVLWRKEQTDQ